MRVLDKKLVKMILSLVKAEGLYGSELSTAIKKENQELDSGKIYLTVRSLKDNAIIASYLPMEENQEDFKVKYKLTKKGSHLLDLLKKGKI